MKCVRVTTKIHTGTRYQVYYLLWYYRICLDVYAGWLGITAVPVALQWVP